MLRAIGTVISEWAKVEQTLYLSLTNAFGGPPDEEIRENHVFTMLLSTGMDSRTMMGLLRGFVRLGFPSIADEFDKLIDRLAEEGKRRNVIAHAVWRKGARPGSIQTIAIRAVGEIRYDVHDYTVAELERLAERIGRARRDLLRFMRRLGYFRASPDKSTSQAP